MGLSFLSIENVRCLEHVELSLDAGHNLIWGPNGSGKTSLLEALFMLGRGRSFRTRNTTRVIRYGEPQLVVFGRTSEPQRTIAVQATRGGATVGKTGGGIVPSLAMLSEIFPVQIIDPSVHKLVEEGAPRRRRWLDWAVFHVEPRFINAWTRYRRALQQRNAALRAASEEAFIWDPELAQSGEQLSESRRHCLEALQPFWQDTAKALLRQNVSLTFSRGWPREKTLADALRDSRDRDRLRGTTQAGPHRADIQIRLGGVPAREMASRGQQKLIAAAMVLAQLQLLRIQYGIQPTLLLDDPAAELDAAHLEAFIQQVTRLQCQLVTTALSPAPGAFIAPHRRFHVEQGKVRPV